MSVRALSALVFLLASVACSGPRVIVCDQAQHRVAMLEADADWTDAEAMTWQWTAADSPGILAEQRGWFELPTDAKPVLGGDYVLVTASGGGVALVRIDDRVALFHAEAGGNPHSAELLPDGAIVVASSTGNRLSLWRLEDESAPVQSLELLDPHGVAWEPRGRRLWAIGRDQLVALVYRGKDDPAPLEIVERHPLPGPGGHDLVRDAAGEKLLLSTLEGGWRFDPATGLFEPYPGLEHTPDVKSLHEPVHLDPGLPTLVVRAEEEWWSSTVRSADLEWSRTLPGSQIYKARWWFDGSHPPRDRNRFTFGVGVGFLVD